MVKRKPIELTEEERRKAEEHSKLMSALMDFMKKFNDPNSKCSKELAANSVQLGKMTEAVLSGELWSVKLALNNGADPNETNALLGTALHTAASSGHLEIVQLLVEQGADPTRVDPKGRTPADVAATNGHHAIAEYLRSLER